MSSLSTVNDGTSGSTSYGWGARTRFAMRDTVVPPPGALDLGRPGGSAFRVVSAVPPSPGAPGGAAPAAVRVCPVDLGGCGRRRSAPLKIYGTRPSAERRPARRHAG